MQASANSEMGWPLKLAVLAVLVAAGTAAAQQTSSGSDGEHGRKRGLCHTLPWWPGCAALECARPWRPLPVPGTRCPMRMRGSVPPLAPHTAVDALLAQRAAITNWDAFAAANNVSGWQRDVPLCTWTGVTCDASLTAPMCVPATLRMGV